MPFEDAEEAVAFSIEHEGPYAAIVTAGYVLLNDVQEIDQLSREFHPDDGPTRKGLNSADRSQFDAWFASMVVALGAGIERLQRLMRESGVWGKLCEANPYTATVADFHGQCFAGCVRDLGLSRYGVIYKAVDPTGAREWLRYSLARWERLAIKPEAITGRVDDALRAVAEEREFDFSRVYMDLIKERQRADGSFLDKEDAPTIVGPNDERDAWLYEQKKNGATYKAMLAGVKARKEDWDQLASDPSIYAAIRRYTRKEKLPAVVGKRQK